MYGFRGDRESHVEGLNSRLDELQAALLRVKLRALAETNAERRELAARYAAGLGETAWRPLERPDDRTHAWHLHVVRGPSRERAAAALEAAGIGWGVHYPVAAHLMEAWRGALGAPGSLPVTEGACREVLTLPLWPGLGASAVDEVVRVLARIS
jgi:dTDP-4-amino-4,6-dideoxygalactose transaminase